MQNQNRLQKYSFLFCLLLSVMPVVTFVTVRHSCAATAKQEWLLTQMHDQSNPVTIHLTEDAIKVDETRLGFTILYKSPEWKVHCFRTDDKTEWTGTLNEFCMGRVLNPLNPITKLVIGKAPARVGELKHMGMPCTKYRTLYKDIICANDIKISPMLMAFYARLYSLPKVDTAPLHIVDTRAGKAIMAHSTPKVEGWMDQGPLADLRVGKRLYVYTKSIAAVPYRSSDFALPKNYKQTNTLAQISYSQEKKGEIDSLINDIGFLNKENKTGKYKPAR